MIPELLSHAASESEKELIGEPSVAYDAVAPYLSFIDQFYLSYPNPEVLRFNSDYPTHLIDGYLKHDRTHITRTLINTVRLIEKYKKNHPGELKQDDEVIAMGVALYHDVNAGDPDDHAARGAHFILDYAKMHYTQHIADMIVAGVMVHSQLQHRDHFPIAFKLAFDADALDLPRMRTIPDEKITFLTQEARSLLAQSKHLIGETWGIHTSQGVLEQAVRLGMVRQSRNILPLSRQVYVQ